MERAVRIRIEVEKILKIDMEPSDYPVAECC
jgi:hypothetical protein